jgi:hypothetical protein
MPLEDWTPATTDVAALLRARTKDTNGNEVGDFNDDTRPTGAEVESLISSAVGEVSSRIGTDTPCEAGLLQRSKGSAALYAAMLVELSYFPEQVRTDRSPYDRYKELYDDGITSLSEEVISRCGEDEGESDVEGSGLLPYYAFGDQDPIGRRTVW